MAIADIEQAGLEWFDGRIKPRQRGFRSSGNSRRLGHAGCYPGIDAYKAACINHSTALMLKKDSTVVASKAAAQKPSCWYFCASTG